MCKMSKGCLSVVLVNTQFPGNLGSVARAMKNMGIQDLSLVNSVEHMGSDAKIMAVGAADILEKAKKYPNLKDALANNTLVFGTTRRAGKLRHPLLTPWQMAEKVFQTIENNNIAFVFGPEDRGLTTDELLLCHHIVSIPTENNFGSLNLSHAVMVILYEIKRQQLLSPPPQHPRLANVELMEEMYDQLQKTLLKIGFLDPVNPRRIMKALKSIAVRAGFEERDVTIIRGLIHQFNWFCHNRLNNRFP